MHEPYPFRDLHEPIHRLVDAYGPRRTFWGTDLTRMPCTYYECIHLFTDHLPWLTGEDLEWVMGRGDRARPYGPAREVSTLAGPGPFVARKAKISA